MQTMVLNGYNDVFAVSESLNKGKMYGVAFRPYFHSCVENQYTDFLFRMGYLIWILKGANLLKPLQWYANYMDTYSDDYETLRGAYGPRLRRWVGPDALQEAINKNQNIDDEENYVKPSGVDQLEAVYLDLKTGMQLATMQLFDPALDFDDTNYVPDLHSVFFAVRDGGEVDMILNYGSIGLTGHIINDIWAMEMIRCIICNFAGKPVGGTNVVIASLEEVRNVSADNCSFYDSCSREETMFPDGYFGGNVPEVFWEMFHSFIEFEKHLRMQVNERSFHNQEICVTELTDLLREYLFDNVDVDFLRDIGICMLICAIVKYCDKVELYGGYLRELAAKVKSDGMRHELTAYLSVRGYPELVTMVGL